MSRGLGDVYKRQGQERFEELCNLEVDVPIRTVVPEIIEELELSTKDYMALEFMIAGD